LNGKITQETLLQRLVDGDWLGELDVMAELEATQAVQAARFREQADRVGSALGNLNQQQQADEVQDEGEPENSIGDS
jgi:hypothetical protein